MHIRRTSRARLKTGDFPIDGQANKGDWVNHNMGEMAHCKCPCKECGNNLEFPAYAARTTVPCPHCGQWTELLLPETLAEPKSLDLTTILLIGCAVVVMAGAVWLHNRPSPKPDDLSPPPIVKVAPEPAIKPVPPPAPTNPPPPAPVIQTPATPNKPKSADDLKTGEVTLEKTPGNSLVYATGVVKNDSDWQRFGIRVELDLLNKKGDKLGTTGDYKDILEPRQEWKFRALIPDKHTATAKVTSLKEQE